jgi:cytochrome c peroxidase
MNRFRVSPSLGALLMATLAGGCAQSRAEPVPAPRNVPPSVSPGEANRTAINPRLLRRFKPIAQTVAPPATSPEMISLGHLLFFESRLSRSGKISCNSCHDLSNYGVDHRPTSKGERGQVGTRNAPTVYNAAEHLAQFWDGRARDVEEQAIGPILNPIEMAATRESVEATLRAIPEYRALFRQAFPGAGTEPVTLENVGRAIGAFERQLVTRSRWDDYLAGRTDALLPGEVQGLRVFLEVGCMGCHTGPQIGASMFQITGFVEPWPNQKDAGRYSITKVPADRMMFKVPTLKNITRTGPYFHDGSIRDLATAIRTMGRHQLGIELSDGEVASIATFFEALEGTLPSQYLTAPRLPGAASPRKKG